MPELRRIDTTESPARAGAITDAEGAAMARAALRLSERWGVTDREAAVLLGGLGGFGPLRAGRPGRSAGSTAIARRDCPTSWASTRACG